MFPQSLNCILGVTIHTHSHTIPVGGNQDIYIYLLFQIKKRLSQMTEQQFRTLGRLIHTADTLKAGKIGHHETAVQTQNAALKRKSKCSGKHTSDWTINVAEMLSTRSTRAQKLPTQLCKDLSSHVELKQPVQHIWVRDAGS